MLRFIAIILLIVVAWQSGGYYMAFEITQRAAHQTAQANIQQKNYRANDVVTITIPKAELQQLRHFYKDEYLINGKLYDLLQIKQQNDSTLQLYCLHDAQEQSIYDNLYQYAAPLHSPIGAKKAQQLAQVLSLKYIVPQLLRLPSPTLFELSIAPVFAAYLPQFWRNIVQKTHSPPPESACA